MRKNEKIIAKYERSEEIFGIKKIHIERIVRKASYKIGNLCAANISIFQEKRDIILEESITSLGVSRKEERFEILKYLIFHLIKKS
jgi:hypothetical protein